MAKITISLINIFVLIVMQVSLWWLAGLVVMVVVVKGDTDGLVDTPKISSLPNGGGGQPQECSSLVSRGGFCVP